MNIKNRTAPGFTIVELLVVIVVIGILAAITIVSYSGITQKAIVASLKSDLNNSSTQLKMFQVDNSNYPITIDCAQADSTTNKCLKASSGNTYNTATYASSVNNSTNPQTFSLTSTNTNGTCYNITNETGPTTCATQPAPLFFDDFNRVDGTLGANWTVQGTPIVSISGNKMLGSGNVAYANSAGSQTDVKVSFTLPVVAASGNIGILLRCSTPNNDFSTVRYWAVFIKSNNTMAVYRGGGEAQVGSTVSGIVISAGDSIAASIVGSAIKVFHNDTQIFSGTDSTFASGYAGVRFSTAGGTYAVDNFKVEVAQ